MRSGDSSLQASGDNAAAASSSSSSSQASASSSEDSLFPTDLLREGFVSPINYEMATKGQTARDWIRHKDQIFLNGFSLSLIVDNLKKEYLKTLLSNFLYEDRSSAEKIAKRIRVLNEFSIKLLGHNDNLKHLKADEECLIPDKFAVDLLIELKKIIYNVDINDKQGNALYPLSVSPEMDELRKIIKLHSHYFSIEKMADSANLLTKIWDDYLFVGFKENINREEFVDLLFKFGHASGFLFSLFAAHLQHIDKYHYVIEAGPCIDQSKIYFVCTDQSIIVTEITPIIKITVTDDIDTYIANNDNSNAAVTTICHRIALDSQGKARLTIQSALAEIANPVMKAILFGSWLKMKKMLCEYADHFIQNDHDQNKINEIFSSYPDLTKIEPLNRIPSLTRKLSASKNTQHQGDKIFLYLGKHFTEYAETLLSRMNLYVQQGEKYFLRAMSVFKSMGRTDIVNQVLMPIFMHQDLGQMIANGQVDDGDSKLKKAYTHLAQFSILSKPIKMSVTKAEDNFAPSNDSNLKTI